MSVGLRAAGFCSKNHYLEAIFVKKCFLLTLFSVLLFSVSAAWAAPQDVYIEEVEYKGRGVVEIDVESRRADDTRIVWTAQETAVVRDSRGAVVPAELSKHDEDTYRLKIKNPLDGETYSFSLADVSVGSHQKMIFTGYVVAKPRWKTSMTGDTPMSTTAKNTSQSLFIAKMEFERSNRLEIEFEDAAIHDSDIFWDHSEKITVRDSAGKVYPVQVRKYDDDSLDITVNGLTRGSTYRVKIEGIPYKGQKVTLEGDFVAISGWEFKDPRSD